MQITSTVSQRKMEPLNGNPNNSAGSEPITQDDAERESSCTLLAKLLIFAALQRLEELSATSFTSRCRRIAALSIGSTDMSRFSSLTIKL